MQRKLLFLLSLLVLVALEATIPTRAFPNPIELVRSAIRRRSRTKRYLQILTIASRDGAGKDQGWSKASASGSIIRVEAMHCPAAAGSGFSPARRNRRDQTPVSP